MPECMPWTELEGRAWRACDRLVGDGRESVALAVWQRWVSWWRARYRG